jgi:hypothetical protein
MRENPYDFVSKDSKGRNALKESPDKKTDKKGEDN